MDYSMVVKRLRMQMVLDSIDGGNGPGNIKLLDGNNVTMVEFQLTKPSFYMVGDVLELAAPTQAFVAVAGDAKTGTVSDGSGNVVITQLSVGVDTTDDSVPDYEIVLDKTLLAQGEQVTIIKATIEHG